MFKAKEFSLKSLGVYLTLSLVAAAGVVMFRPHQIASQSAPLFMGEEVVVRQTAKAAPVSRATTAVKPITAANTIRPAAAPVILPIVPPSIISKVLPEYPSAALQQELAGTVILSVYVGLGGQAEKIETKLSSGVAQLDDTAVKAIAQWRFAPATQGSSAIASWYEIPVSFRIGN
ncbi:MAG TPA: energy transducer TonB [Candidatus Sulfotelmatobacter sp.]|nr:energy transducer TonB [Candidatus Sulfotelmatobacter sp.]